MNGNVPFAILLPYGGKHVMAIAQQADSPITVAFDVKFPDGYKTTFVAVDASPETPTGADDLTYDSAADDDIWSEDKHGITKLSREVSPYLDEYLINQHEYVEPFTEAVNGQQYIFQPVDHCDYVYYNIYRDGAYLFSLQMGINGMWELRNEESDPVGEIQVEDENLVTALGETIERHDD